MSASKKLKLNNENKVMDFQLLMNRVSIILYKKV